MHRHQDIATSHKLLVNEQLWYGGPVGVFFDTYRANMSVATFLLQPSSTDVKSGVRTRPQVLVLQNIERGELVRVHALQAQYLN